ncbi:MAG: outer membrane beta-barrel protein [Pyrinomonadaceae bacterium]
MKTRALFTQAAFVLALLACASPARAQERDAPKVEVGVQYTSLSINHTPAGGTENTVGFGARATYNFNDYFAVEAEGNVYTGGTQRRPLTGGPAQQAQFGVKAGKRWNTFGLFAKARPGLVSFGETLRPVAVGGGVFNAFDYVRERKTHFSMDVGAVLEFYPSRRTLVRFDAGDTMIRYGDHADIVPAPGTFQPSVGTARGEVGHNFQFTAGVGFRLGGNDDDGGGGAARTSTPRERVRRFEVGVQFSSFVLNLSPSDFGAPSFAPFDEGSNAEAGGGLRVGFNITDNLAVEAEGNFYPRRRYGISTTIGGYPSQFQAGVKYGRRYERFGVFAKARPGFMHFSNVARVTGVDTFTFGGQTFFFPTFEGRGRTYFSFDAGGVLEFYPSERLFTRFDVGDTMIRYPERDATNFFLSTPPGRQPAELRHNLQVTAGIGFRF